MSVPPTGQLELAVHAVKDLIKSPWSISSSDFIFSYNLGWENKIEKKQAQSSRNYSALKKLIWHSQQKGTVISTPARSQRTHANSSIYFLCLLSNFNLLGTLESFITKYSHKSSYITSSSPVNIQSAGWRLAERPIFFRHIKHIVWKKLK